jgi:putative ABC transport system permease protein
VLRSYAAIALRQLVAQKLYTAINVGGLAVGLAAAGLVGLYVRHELSYDGFHENADRIFRVARTFTPPGAASPLYDASMPPVVAPLLESDFADVEETARLRPLDRDVVVVVGEKSYSVGWLAAADRELPGLFDFEWLEGEREVALRDPYSVVLTKSVARRLFGDRSALGETLLYRDMEAQFTVSGVIGDLPANTHLRFDMLVPMQLLSVRYGSGALERWNDGAFHTYLLLRPGGDAARIQGESQQFFERHMPGGLGALNDFTLERLTDLHLSMPRMNQLRPPGSAAAVYASGVVAALILGIACSNFVNLATASARRRAKEVGVRKSLGAVRGRLVAQFLGESLLLTAIAALLALAAVELLLPAVGAFLERPLDLDYRGDPWSVVALLCVTLVAGVAAGSFPAFYVSAFEAAKVLKGDITRGRSAALLRSILVGAQFAIGIALLIATAVVYRQMQFMRNVDLGYQKEQIVVVSGQRTGRLPERWEILQREWLAHPEIVAATASSQAPGSGAFIADVVRGDGSDPQAPPVDVRFVGVDFDFFATYGIDVVAGRAFSSDFGTDLADVALTDDTTTFSVAVVNARAARALGWAPEEAVGKTFWSVPLSNPASGPTAGSPAHLIVGVIDDIYFQPLRDPVGPLVFMLPRPLANVASLKVTGRDLEATLAHIDEVWAKVVPEQPIVRHFLDDDFAALYRDEERQGLMLTYGALLAILLACLGLFGLASLTIEQRMKEIGIRKVMGGTVTDVIGLFAGEFGRLVVLANLAAWPVAFLAMRRWLDQFPYRIDLGVLVFVGSGALVLAIAWLTVGIVAARAAGAKPAHTLRYE